MRVKISTNSPLPPLRAWIPLAPRHGETIFTFKSLLCTSLPAFRNVSPASLQLAIDGFELLNVCDLSMVRDGDLISVDVCEATASVLTQTQKAYTTSPRPRAKPMPGPSTPHKRKRALSTPSKSESDAESSSSSGSDSSELESESKSETSDSGSESDVSSVGKAVVPTKERAKVTPKSQPLTFVPPGYGKPQTRSRNLRRRLRRQHEREAGASSSGPASGANAIAPGEATQDANGDTHSVPSLMSLSLRNKNKAKNFKSLMNKPLPSKIIFGDEEGVSAPSSVTQTQDPPQLIPPSMRSSLPPNMFVTSVDVEAKARTEKNIRRIHDEYGDGFEENITLDYGGEEEVDVNEIEAMANDKWSTLAKLTRSVTPGMLVGSKALGIDPVTFTPGQVVTACHVESCDAAVLVVRPLRAVSFNWAEKAEVEEHSWEEIQAGDWRML